MKNLVLLLVISFSFAHCNTPGKQYPATETNEQPEDYAGEKSPGQEKESIPADHDTGTNSKAEILNNIIVHESGGVKVSRAFLSFEDGSLVPKTNRTELGKPVYLHLLLKTGWKVNGGMISIDASEKIVSDAGELVLDAANLFNATPLIKEEDGKTIYLEATITRTRKNIKYFLVSYRVWDRLGEGEIKGSYKLFVDEATK